MGVPSTVRRTLGRAGGKARRLLPLAAALLLAALLAIPASNIALALAPPGNEIVLVNTAREFVERKGGGEFVARPVFDREIANLFYAVRDADGGDWISAMYRVKGGEKKRSDGWEYSWEYPDLDEHPELDRDRAYLLVMLAKAEDGRIVNVSVVVATAVNGEGKREIIGMDVGTSEDGAFWLAFLRSLSARGLSGVELVVSDAHQGLRGAIAAVFGGASWQRCRTHFMTNLLTRVPRRVQPWMATMVRTIYQQPSPDEVHAQLDRVTDQLGDRFPQVASLLDEAGPDILAFSSFPVAHWKKIWSNNPLERLTKEIRRRTDVVGIFPNRPAVRRLVGAVLAEQHDEWAVGRRYLTPAILILNEALPEADLAEATAA